MDPRQQKKLLKIFSNLLGMVSNPPGATIKLLLFCSICFQIQIRPYAIIDIHYHNRVLFFCLQ